MESTVMICHWKPLLLISIFLVITSSTEGGPAEDNARNMEIPDKSDQLQMYERKYFHPFSRDAGTINRQYFRPNSTPLTVLGASRIDINHHHYIKQSPNKSGELYPQKKLPLTTVEMEYMDQSHLSPFKTFLNLSKVETIESPTEVQMKNTAPLNKDSECWSESKILHLEDRNARRGIVPSSIDSQYQPRTTNLFDELTDTTNRKSSASPPNFFTIPLVESRNDNATRSLHHVKDASKSTFHSYEFNNSAYDNHYLRLQGNEKSHHGIPGHSKNKNEEEKMELGESKQLITDENYKITYLPKGATMGNETLWHEPTALTKIILKPLASATAGKQGIAIASPVSTAYVKRGDSIEIEYLPQANAEVGEGGIAISRPELIIHLIDKRK